MKKNILLLAGIMMIVAACTNKESKTEIVKTVKVASVEHYGETGTLSFPGKVKAASDINLSFRIAG
ncbi:MAG: efflux RND transporter periplasmic adaptor subunit, partial [Bacteroidales bacterium]|nr:efflux RND transporter periplasmic adaptor subunit [Bacteroidales bacterium]